MKHLVRHFRVQLPVEHERRSRRRHSDTTMRLLATLVAGVLVPSHAYLASPTSGRSLGHGTSASLRPSMLPLVAAARTESPAMIAMPATIMAPLVAINRNLAGAPSAPLTRSGGQP